MDRAWYAELEDVSAVAADIGGVSSTHINHLTPRVLDIDELYRRMSAHGIAMIDSIQGPPSWAGPDVSAPDVVPGPGRATAVPCGGRVGHPRVAPGAFGEVEARA